MNWNAVLPQLVVVVVGTGIVAILAGVLAHSFTKARETQARAAEIREKRREESRAVAEILAEWIRPTYTGHFTDEDRWRLQAAYWRNVLAIDRNLIGLLSPLLANEPGSPGTNDLIVEARKTLLGLPEPDISAGILNVWPPCNRAPNQETDAE